jgi:F0F1-type ATP synthase membrane subunit c/vacuolar-type H+-ATPase subunit K
VTATGREIAGLSKDDAAKLMAGRLAAVLYDKGGDAAKALIVQKLPNSDKSPLSLGPAGMLFSDNHSMFSKYFLFAAVLSVFLLAVAAGMSRGFGRLGAPAFVVALGTAPLAALWAIAGPAIGTGDPNGNAAIFALRVATRSAADDLRSTFVLVVAVAAAAAIVALLGGIALAVFKRVRQARGPAAPPRATVVSPEPRPLPQS